MRVANAGMQPTRRLDWIALRAKVALRGEEWHEGMRDEPGDSRAELIKKNAKLRERLKMYESEQFAAKGK